MNTKHLSITEACTIPTFKTMNNILCDNLWQKTEDKLLDIDLKVGEIIRNIRVEACKQINI